MALLDVQDLSVVFTRRGEPPVTAVDGLSFSVEPGQTVGLVGESGCGKSVTSLAIMGLLPSRGTEVSGSVLFEGTDPLGRPGREMRRRRGRVRGMVFQARFASLNPVMSMGMQVAEVVQRHRGASRREAMRAAADLLERVGLPERRRRLGEYALQLSGG